MRARQIAAKAALAQIDTLAGQDWADEQTLDRLRNVYRERRHSIAVQAGKIDDDRPEDQSRARQRMMQLILQAQRDALLHMRGSGQLSNEATGRVLHELDLEETRLEI